MQKHCISNFIILLCIIFGLSWFIVFNFPSTTRSFRVGSPIYCPLRRTLKLGFYTVPTGNRTPGGSVAVHDITASHASSSFLIALSLRYKRLQKSFWSPLIFEFTLYNGSKLPGQPMIKQ